MSLLSSDPKSAPTSAVNEWDGGNNFSCGNLFGPQGMDDIPMRATNQTVQIYHKDREGSIAYITGERNGVGGAKWGRV